MVLELNLDVNSASVDGNLCRMSLAAWLNIQIKDNLVQMQQHVCGLQGISVTNYKVDSNLTFDSNELGVKSTILL